MAAVVQRVERRPATGGLAAAFMVALAIHSAGLLGLASWRSEAARPPGEQEITIDLAPLMQEAETVEPAEVAEPQQAVETATLAVPEATTAEPTPETVTASEPDQVEEPVREEAIAALPPPAEDVRPPDEAAAEPPPQDASTVAPSPEAAVTEVPPVEAPPAGIEGAETLPAAESAEALPPGTADLIAPPNAPLAEDVPEAATVEMPETVVAPEPPRPTRQPMREAKPERKPEQRPVRPKRDVAEQPTRPPRRVAARPAASAPSSPQRGRLAASRESNAASADPNARNRYAAMISAAVRRRLRFPASARSRGSGGTATVRFTVHRSGRVMSASLVRSAGDGTLDRAALATVAPGSSLPAAPDGVPQQQITFVVPLRFNLR